MVGLKGREDSSAARRASRSAFFRAANRERSEHEYDQERKETYQKAKRNVVMCEIDEVIDDDRR